VKRLKLDDEFVVIAGKSKGPGWTLDDDGPIVKRVIDWAKETYPIDPRRVYLWGSSNGAGFIGRFGWENQDLVAAAVGYCGGYNFAPKGAKGEKPGEGKTEWYFVHGGNDNPQNSFNGCKQLKEMGYRYVFRQLDGYGHTDIWDGAGHPDQTVVNEVRDDYMRWLDALRHKEIEPEKRDREWLAKFENKSSAESYLGSKAAYLNLQRIGGPQAGAIIAMGLQSKSGGVKASAAEACERTSFGKVAADELVKLVTDDSDRVQQAALRALGTYAVWHYTEAMDALAHVALAPKGDSKGPTLADRLVALEGIARGLKLAWLGNFEDKKMFWALVQLLDDDEIKMRAAAFQLLSRGVTKDAPSGYKPDLSGQARKDAVAKWAEWCTKKCGPLDK